jgi:sulfur relay (sulfurtransferase) DsrC/TusE family protein
MLSRNLIHGQCRLASAARTLMKTLEDELAGLGGHRFLYSLFPHGPIATATRDPSFGSTH